MKKNFLVFVITTLICLLLLEIALRFVSPPPHIGVGTAKTPKAKIYGWAMPPNQRLPFVNPDTGERSYFNTNSEGWKDVDHQFSKPHGVTRILFIGDSHTWGYVTLDDLYTRHVEYLLKKKISQMSK